jgi:hypothetical protein
MAKICVMLLALLAVPVTGLAQTTGQVFGKVADSSGAVLPGVTVTLTGSTLLQPRTAITSETGTYQFPGLATGVYTVRFELSGFGTVVRSDIRIEQGFSAQINTELGVAGLDETITVAGVSPVVDVRSTTQGVHFDSAQLQAIPSGRDVFSMLSQTPGITVDRQNVGGSSMGQQTQFVSRGATASDVRTSVDGVEVGTGTNASWYLDFDSFEELQINTGGADVTMMTPGATMNMVTKSGTNKFRTTFRGFLTDQALESDNTTPALRAEGASSGNPILNIKDVGGELGGPIVRDRAWFWGAYSRQDASNGINGFYKKTTECGAVAADPLAHSVADVRDCLLPDTVKLRHFNYRLTWQPFKNNQFSLRNGYDIKLQDARGASDITAIEATTSLAALNDRSFGARFWTTGWAPSWRFSDQHTLSDRWFVEGGYSRFCACINIGFREPSLAVVQPMAEISGGHMARSATGVQMTATIRNNTDVTTVYFLPGRLGGDHSLKGGYKNWYVSNTGETGITGGGVIARFNSGTRAPFTTPFSARFSRTNVTEQYLMHHSVFFQDTFTRGRLTLNLGVRWDRQDDRRGETVTPGSPFQGQVTMTGVAFNLLPEVRAEAASSGIIWNNIAPRLGITYDVTGNGKNVLKGSYAQYYGQRAPAELSTVRSVSAGATVDLPWVDLNGDKFVQANEVDPGRILAFGGAYNPANPTQTTSPNSVDPDLKNERTDEIVAGFSKELAAGFGVSASYIWRNYGNLNWNRLNGLTSADFTEVIFTPPASACPAGARCERVSYFVPNIPLPAAFTRETRPDHHRQYHGLELVARKRMSNAWMMTGSFAFNDSRVFYDSPAAYQDPTNIATEHDAQYAPSFSNNTGGSAVRLNAKWVTRVNGAYQLPWLGVGLAASYDLRQGYPFVQTINIASRPNRASAVQVNLDPIGDVRMPTFQSMDLRVDKSVAIASGKLSLSLDVFNVFNFNTVLSRSPIQNASNADRINGILGPRVARIGATLSF